MATITPSPRAPSGAVTIILWETLTSTNADGGWVPLPLNVTSLYVQSKSADYGGGTITMQGSNDGGTTAATLKDPNNGDVSFTANGAVGIRDFPAAIRPLLSGATGGDVDVYLVIRSG